MALKKTARYGKLSLPPSAFYTLAGRSNQHADHHFSVAVMEV